MKKIAIAMLIIISHTSAYAYLIANNLTVVNKTAIPLVIEITEPNQKNPVPKQIPALSSIHIHTENDDHSGLLYQTSTTPFTIKNANGKLYAQGRIAYYVGASVWNKYSFLDAISATNDVNIDTVYSCRNGGSAGQFTSKIIIDGTPGTQELAVKDFPAKIYCESIKSAVFNDDNQDYSLTCSDDSNSIFHQMTKIYCEKWGCWWLYQYSNGEQRFKVNYHPDTAVFKKQLDELIATAFCGKW